MSAKLTRLLAFFLAISLPMVTMGFGGGAAGLTTTGCGGCHADAGDGITANIDCPSPVSPSQVVNCTVSVMGSPGAGGGFNAGVTAGMLSAGANSQVVSGELVQVSPNSRSWTFSFTAPSTAMTATLQVAAMGSDLDGSPNGDDWVLGEQDIVVQAAADSDGDGTPDDFDCAPFDPSIHPAAPENCSNGIDDDCDDLVDDLDPSCSGALVLGDVAPPGMPDGLVNIADAVRILRFGVELEIPDAEEMVRADIAPGSVLDEAGTLETGPAIFIPEPDGVIGIGDAVVAIRAAVSIIEIQCAPQPNAVAIAVGDDRVFTGTMVTLDGSGSTNADTLEWELTTPAGSTAMLSSSTAVSPTFTADLPGTYTATLTASNCAGAATAMINVTVADVFVVAGVDTSNYDGESTGIGMRVLSGRRQYTTNFGSTDARLVGSESMGAGPVSYRWEQVGGPRVELSDPTAANPTFTAPTPLDILEELGTDRWGVLPIWYHDLELLFQLVVTSDGASASSIVEIYLEQDGLEVSSRADFMNVGLGSRVYLEGAATEEDGDPIDRWEWWIDGPAGDPSPVVTDADTRTPSFVPMAEGVYEVNYRVDSVSLAADGFPDDEGSFFITSARYVGSNALAGTPDRPGCAACHAGTVEEDIVTPWLGTDHAGDEFARIIAPGREFFFKESTASIAFLDPSQNPPVYELKNPTYCMRCHTGWNTLPTADNDGLDDRILAAGFEVAPGGMSFDAVIADFPDIANIAGQQCESCHGAGGGHDGNLAGNAMSISLGVDTCAQCHAQGMEWRGTRHEDMRLEARSFCAQCHSAQGFIRFTKGESLSGITDPQPITCVTCHDPHSAENDYQLRLHGEIELPEGLVVDAGAAAVCYGCHNGRYSDPEAQADRSFRSAHHNTQGPLLEGIGVTRNFSTRTLELTESSFHSGDAFILRLFTGDPRDSDENDKCVTCHMVQGPSVGQPGHRSVGGHAWQLVDFVPLGSVEDSDDLGTGEQVESSSLFRVPGASFTSLPEHAQLVVEEGEDTGTWRIVRVEDDETLVVNTVFDGGDATDWRIEETDEIQMLGACTSCHSGITDFNRMSRGDYDGDGEVEGVQDEVQGLLDRLGSKLVAIDQADGGGRAIVPSEWAEGSLLGIDRDFFDELSQDMKFAVWNWLFIWEDKSNGVHDTAFTVQLLQETYTAISLANSMVDDPRTPQDDAGLTFPEAFPAASIR